MVLEQAIAEFQSSWLPHITTAGLCRIIELLEKDSPYLLYGSFATICPIGCLASQIAWQHPHTENLGEEAGVVWLMHIAHLNPATSAMIQYWDAQQFGLSWSDRCRLITVCRACLAERNYQELPYTDAMLQFS